VLEALVAANSGHALAYGTDVHTQRAEQAFSELFGRDVRTLFVYGGTGANVLALASLLQPAESVICTDWAHIHVDETGAPEKILGAKLLDLPCPDAKLTPSQVRAPVATHITPNLQSCHLPSRLNLARCTAPMKCAQSVMLRMSWVSLCTWMQRASVTPQQR